MMAVKFAEEMLKHYVTYVPDAEGKSGLCFHTERDPDQPVTSGNHHVINAVMHQIFQSLRTDLRDSDAARAEMLLMFGAENFIEACRAHFPGEFHRAPTKLQDQSHDDLIGIATTSWIFGLPYAREILDAGRAGRRIGWFRLPWYFDNTLETPRFEFSNWFLRFPWFPSFIKAAASERLSWWDHLTLTIHFLAGVAQTDRTAVSGRQLRYLMAHVLFVHGRSRMLKWAMNLWVEDQKKTYPWGWGEAMGIYHKPSKGHVHPFENHGSLAFDSEFLNNPKYGDDV